MSSKVIKRCVKEPPKDITPKQQLFCAEYVTNGFNKADAVLKAGFNTKNPRIMAARLLKKPKIAKFMKETMKDIQHRLGITAEWKCQKLKDCAEESLNREANDGKIIPAGVIGSIAELNKMSGEYPIERSMVTNINADTEAQDVKDLVKFYTRDA